jgi:hypothetical protein
MSPERFFEILSDGRSHSFKIEDRICAIWQEETMVYVVFQAFSSKRYGFIINKNDIDSFFVSRAEHRPISGNKPSEATLAKIDWVYSDSEELERLVRPAFEAIIHSYAQCYEDQRPEKNEDDSVWTVDKTTVNMPKFAFYKEDEKGELTQVSPEEFEDDDEDEQVMTHLSKDKQNLYKNLTKHTTDSESLCEDFVNDICSENVDNIFENYTDERTFINNIKALRRSLRPMYLMWKACKTWMDRHAEEE